MSRKLYTMDSLEFLKSRANFEFDINYSDPPYALGSEIIIREDGKVDYKNARDFMNKWEMPTGDYWEKWFKEAYRTLKYGGSLIMFGIDRQCLIFKYYAQMAGFVEQQSMYWFYISSFPKATDLSKMIDKYLGNEREVVGSDRSGKTSRAFQGEKFTTAGEYDITQSTSDLGKKYEGYKYSIAPLKQTNETIMIFKKPTKTGSVLHDTIAYENGDNEITVGAINIDGNRVGFSTQDTDSRIGTDIVRGYKKGLGDNQSIFGGNEGINKIGVQMYKDGGRYPAQVIIDDGAAQILDEQSGETTGNNAVGGGSGGIWTKGDGKQVSQGYADTGGASKILHTIEPDLYIYQPKVSNMERNAGLEGFEEKPSASSEFRPNHTEKALLGEGGNPYGRWKPLANNHPTLKPIDLNYKILNLYKTPNPQKIVYPFAGAGSEIIGGLKANFTDWVGCEISQDYVDIANARIKYWGENFKHGYTEIKVEKETIVDGQVSLF